MVAQYSEWMQRQQGAIILTEYTGLTMKQIDDLRSKVREAGGEFHIVKNTLGKLAFKEAGLPLPAEFPGRQHGDWLCIQDAQPMAKVMTDFARTSDFLKIKGGYLGKRPISAKEVNALADLPPLPVMRASLWVRSWLQPASWPGCWQNLPVRWLLCSRRMRKAQHSAVSISVDNEIIRINPTIKQVTRIRRR